jgi:FAD/FMN-containing dehydrogenase
MSGGSLTQSISINMSRHFAHVGDADLSTKTIWVAGGAMHLKVEEATHPKGLLFAPYTSSRDICGIGGMIGNNASGEKSVRYGATSRNVGQLNVLCSDGEVYEFGPLNRRELAKKKALPTFEGMLYREVTKLIDDNEKLINYAHPRTVKNGSGYAVWELWDESKSHFNMARLFVGSQGTLGITTEAELKLINMATSERMIVIPIDTMKDLVPVVKTILKHRPVTVETFDHHTYELAKEHFPDDAFRAKISDGKHMVVFAIFDGDSPEHADKEAGSCKDELEKNGNTVVWVDDAAERESFLLIRRKSFRMLLEHPLPNTRALAFLEDTIVPLEHYAEYLAALESILAEYKMTYTYAGHIGDGSIRLIPLVNVEAEGAADQIMELESRVNDLVMAFAGSISVDHNDGLIRSPYLEQFFGKDMFAVMTVIKNIFDPLNIFNPGKKIGGSFDYSKAHIIRSNTPPKL